MENVDLSIGHAVFEAVRMAPSGPSMYVCMSKRPAVLGHVTEPTTPALFHTA